MPHLSSLVSVLPGFVKFKKETSTDRDIKSTDLQNLQIGIFIMATSSWRELAKINVAGGCLFPTLKNQEEMELF